MLIEDLGSVTNLSCFPTPMERVQKKMRRTLAGKDSGRFTPEILLKRRNLNRQDERLKVIGLFAVEFQRSLRCQAGVPMHGARSNTYL